MRRVSLIAVLSLLLLVAFAGPAAAQEGDTDLSECDPQSETYEDCLAEHGTVEDVREWMQKAPDELTETQKAALYAVSNANASEFSNETLARLDEWKEWDNGRSEKPDWFGSPLNETSDDEQNNSRSENADEINKYKEIRPGQWFVEKPEFDDDGTGKAVIYSEFDGRVAFVDNGDCTDNSGGVCLPDVTNAEVSAGETTTIQFDATVKPGVFSNGDQAVTFNSLTDRNGNYKLAVALLEDEDEPFFNNPNYDLVWIGVVTAILTLSGLALLTYAYIWWRRRLLEENLFEYLIENV